MKLNKKYGSISMVKLKKYEVKVIMKTIDRSEIEGLKKEYPLGTRIVLVKMDDVQAPPIGTKGTVVGVDDIGSLLVHCDNGSTLNVLYGEDICKIIKKSDK